MLFQRKRRWQAGGNVGSDAAGRVGGDRGKRDGGRGLVPGVGNVFADIERSDDKYNDAGGNGGNGIR